MGHGNASFGSAILIVAVVVVVLVGAAAAARRRGYSGIGGDTIVRCRQGHLFTTIWLPGGSFKAIRFGMSRLQFCPVGRHWTWVTPVNDADLTDEDRQFAAQHHDVRIP